MSADKAPLLGSRRSQSTEGKDSWIGNFYMRHVTDHGMKQDTEDDPEVRKWSRNIEKLSKQLKQLRKSGGDLRRVSGEIDNARKKRETAKTSAERKKAGYVYTLDSGYLYRFTPDDPTGHEASKNSCIDLDDAEKEKWKRYRRLLNKRYHHKYSGIYDDDDRILEKAAEDYVELRNDPEVRRYSAEQRCVTVGLAKEKKFLTPLRIKCCYWIWPPIIGMSCYLFQIMMLHVATHYYINYMDAWQAVINGTNFTKLEMQAEAQHNLDQKFNFERIQDGQLWDSMDNFIRHEAEASGKSELLNLPISVMDMIAFVPGAMYALLLILFAVIGHDVNIDIFTKTCFVAACMALAKGILDPITVMPDSSGWKHCQERLGEEGVKSLRDEQAFALWQNLVPHASDIVHALVTEVLGIKTEDGRLRARYCADMLVSGHTYIATVCSLAVFKMVSEYLAAYHLKSSGSEGNFIWYSVKWFVGLICLVCVCIDVASIAATKFHYTVDIIVALVMVVLLWDSAHLETAVARWVSGYRWRMVPPDAHETCITCSGEDTMLSICPPLYWFFVKLKNMCYKAIKRVTCGCIKLKHKKGELAFNCSNDEDHIATIPAGADNFFSRRMSDEDRADLLEERRWVGKQKFTLEEFLESNKAAGRSESEEDLLEKWTKGKLEPAPMVICDSISRKMIDLVKVRREREVFNSSSRN